MVLPGAGEPYRPTAYCNSPSKLYRLFSTVGFVCGPEFFRSCTLSLSRNVTTAPQVLPMIGAAVLTMPAHCVGDVASGTSLAATAFQSNGSLAFCSVSRVKSLSSPAPAVAALNDSVTLPWKPGGSVPNGPAELKPSSCTLELVYAVWPGT